MKDVQCYELFRGIAPKNHAFSLASCRRFVSTILQPTSEPTVEATDDIIATWTSSDLINPDDPSFNRIGTPCFALLK